MISSTHYQLIESISLTELDDEVVVLNLSSGAYYGFNHIGAHLIRALQSSTPIENMVRQIAEQHQMEYSAVHSDIQQLIGQLIEQKLIIESD